ncbi:MAG TPA: hypothetical protein DCY03_33290 [Planctomycetaceae bacterium]|nr:hypothetical protein [Planctomycetaceae bacterium]
MRNGAEAVDAEVAVTVAVATVEECLAGAVVITVACHGGVLPEAVFQEGVRVLAVLHARFLLEVIHFLNTVLLHRDRVLLPDR